MVKITSIEAKRILSPVYENNRFFTCDGKVFSTLEELEMNLKTMKTENFKKHVNSEKNDFSNWIYDVIGDVSLANNIRKVKNKSEILKKIKKHIQELKKCQDEQK